ncbi:hypothetical protein GN244_ATG15444 [Phytophthora infestans]|uniref:Sfi1 spindle body domain-containing protein n=1 Tax=Phytophthora infestans TaxID=4787 RepID=A0A833W7I1_PHYIN|nr:hypothetical protein GN244_ATG15444 [Phytophthora infestans]
MGNRRLANLLAVILRKWSTYGQTRVERRAKADLASLFKKTKLQAKAWRSWLRYTTYCHGEQQQLEWALSYYSVEVLLRRALTSWKKLVEVKQGQRELDELSVWFNTHRLICTGYGKWREYVELQRMKLERVEAQIRTCETLVLFRGVRKWRDRAFVLRQQRENEALARRFFSRRRLKNSLIRLLEWRSSKMMHRRSSTQAKHYRNNKVATACFRYWQRYHEWRVKCAHLTRVLKRNQKGDAFSRWEKYLRRRQVNNENKLQARVFHCIHVELSVLRVLGTFVRGRKQKEVAIALNKAKILCRAFTFWKRRAHVLRQMRNMILYQESFRVQTHLDAWKRFVVATRQMSERLRRTTKRKEKLRKVGVWQKWSIWVSAKRQERATIALAVCDFSPERFSKCGKNELQTGNVNGFAQLELCFSGKRPSCLEVSDCFIIGDNQD